jgi:hypothetical protein
MTGVVDQDVDRNALLAEALMQLNDCRNIREIDLLHHDVDAVPPAQCVGECLKPVQPARHQDHRTREWPCSAYWRANSSPKPLDAPVMSTHELSVVVIWLTCGR